MAEYRRLKANYRPPPPSRHYPDGTPPDYILPGFDTPSLLEPHLDFSFEQRLREELDIRDPPLAFPGNACDPAPTYGFAVVDVARRVW
ncbi:hypothetical protein C8R47DRAFT_1230269 [Mycena vitilis]|nr:hypothetical protein C8R47DRAFT_1230269 [Mycena vitilis]